LRAGCINAPLRGDIQYHGIQKRLHPQRQRVINVMLGIRGTGQVLLEGFQPKTVVNALLQDSAQLQVALDDQHILRSLLFRGDGRRKASGSGADDHYIIFTLDHAAPPVPLCAGKGILIPHRAW